MRSAPLPTMRFKHKSPRGAGEHVVPTWWELGRPLWGGPEDQRSVKATTHCIRTIVINVIVV